MRSAAHWKRNKNLPPELKPTMKEKFMVAFISVFIIMIIACVMVIFGLELVDEAEPVCAQASFMHGGVTKGPCTR